MTESEGLATQPQQGYKTFLAVDLSDRQQRRCVIEMSPLPLEDEKFLISEVREKSSDKGVALDRRSKSVVHTPIRQRIQQRFKTLQQLSQQQPQIPQIYTYFYTSDACYLVRELITGIDLQQKICHEGVLPPAQVIQILSEILRVLVKLHDRNLTHQKIAPEHIILRENNLPVLVGFGNIERQLTTTDCQVQELPIETNESNDVAPNYSSNTDCQAKDIYSLGLTAIYLLTGKSPSDLSTLPTNKIYLPETITTITPDLAAIIKRAIELQASYSATEMLSDLQALPPFPSQNVNATESSLTSNKKREPKTQAIGINKLVVALSLLTVGVATIIVGLLFWQQERTWYRASDNPQPKDEELLRLPRPNVASRSVTVEPPEPVSVSPSQDIPIFVTGIPQNQLLEALGTPQAIARGFWGNSNALIYKNVVDDTVDVSYLVDINSGILRQTEIALAQTLGLKVMQQALSDLLQGKTNPAIEKGLRQVYQRQTDSYTFETEQLEGTIKRIREGKEDNVYIGIWDKDFH
ncbi:protein kinase [Myxosarcina sp. GI1]|uniref:serine/threonine protein kinase n=1 Tax=Myxosarcina sp. GI1 TaxID=1541065 RepID=UPI000566D85B|nr:protein kinase [Myxosarcina sp. GI1]